MPVELQQAGDDRGAPPQQVLDTSVSLPFELPDTVESSTWMMELDFVDMYEGDLGDLELIAFRAPSESAKYWLLGWVAHRRGVDIQSR